MTFVELVSALKSVRANEQRAMREDYMELVVAVEDLAAAEKLLESCLGAPFKPKGAFPSAEANALSAAYGGIQTNQIMYYRQEASGHETALIWPWGNGLQATIKVIKEQV